MADGTSLRWTREEDFVLQLVDAGLLAEDTGPLVKSALLHEWLEHLAPGGNLVPTQLAALSAKCWIQPPSGSTDSSLEARSYLIRMSPSEADARRAQRSSSSADAKEKIFRKCFPRVSTKAEKMYHKLTDPHAILYATLGLNLVSRGECSVATYSREMKAMGVDAQTRTVVSNLLAKAFSAHEKALLHQRTA
ncbi:hypothetical protein ACHHYP_13946 [Achlya hypogyna]|uniref:Uncharacterized protein n=1 Tax=Achlya hypogyna TaxID=1202772 RepID=A0A1V9YEC8_ACHHY|nr:hypothetical protein ACHHYP_13946 [Achlya hypogyna]